MSGGHVRLFQYGVAAHPSLCSFINLMQLVRRLHAPWTSCTQQMKLWKNRQNKPSNCMKCIFSCREHAEDTSSCTSSLTGLQEFSPLAGNCSYYRANPSFPSFVGLPFSSFGNYKKKKKNILCNLQANFDIIYETTINSNLSANLTGLDPEIVGNRDSS